MKLAYFFLTWSEKYIIVTENYGDQKPKFYVPIVTSSAQDNEKVLQQIKTCFKRTINWNKYQSEPTLKTQNRCLNHLIDPGFQRANRLFVLSFENDGKSKKLQATFSPGWLQCRDWCKNYFDQTVQNDFITYENILKIATGQKDDYANSCLLDCNHFKDYYKNNSGRFKQTKSAWCWSKRNTANYFTGNLDQVEQIAVYFMIVEANETVLDFSQGTVRVL